MSRVVRVLDSRWALVAALVWLGALCAVNYWPASYWLDVRSISVGPGEAGKPVPMRVDREVRTAFTGSWFVTVRQWTSTGWVVFCNARGTSNYRVGAELPANLTLGWWTDGRCDHLPRGRYTVDTSWRILGSGILPDKELRVSSNIFEVTP